MPEFNLPEAENFSKYLRTHLKGTLEAKEAETNLDFVRKWDVFYNGSVIGGYFLITRKYKDRVFTERKYIGKIPCYTRVYFIKEQALETIILEFDTQRKDIHTFIPFP